MLAMTEWRPFPGALPKEQIFVIGDVHGRGAALEMVLNRIHETPRSAPLRRLVSLGDVIDRGPSNLYCIDALLSGQETARVDRVDLLSGNHELMLLDAIRDLDSVQFYAQVGGMAVIDELDPDGHAKTIPAVSALLRDKIPAAFLDRMRRSPSHLRLGDLVFVHAGLYPTRDRSVQDRFLAQGADGPMFEHWAWIRDPFLTWTGGWDPEGKTVVLHGHTSVVSRSVHPDTYFEAADRVISHRRLCLDAGSAGLEQVGFAELRGGEKPGYRIGMARMGPALDPEELPGGPG